MREIKVRGYAVEKMVNDQWLYGTGVHKTVYTDEYAERTGVKEEWFIYTESGWEMVKPESIGQYTGLKDKNGKEIYEGDIVRSFVPNRDNAGAIIDYDDEITVFRDIRTAADQFIFLVEPVIVANVFESKGVINLWP